MNKAKILTITKKCKVLAEVELEFGISVKKALSLTGVEMPATLKNQIWLKEMLKFKSVNLNIKDEGYGNYSAVIFLAQGVKNVNVLAAEFLKMSTEFEDA